jgi:hypothetical protein
VSGQAAGRLPRRDLQEVDCDGCGDMLQAGFDKTSIACAAQSAAADWLGVGAFDAGPRCIGLPEFLRCLSVSHRLKRLMEIASPEADDTRLLLRSCALGARGTGVQSRPGKRASKSTPDAGLVFGSQEILCLPAGQVATFASQSIANALLAKPALSRDCQLGSCATGPVISTP